jgi:hypothetical protein
MNAWPVSVLRLERQWHLPAQEPGWTIARRAAVAARMAEQARLNAERRRLNLGSACFVCRRPIAPGEACVVGFLGIIIHMEPGGRPQPCYDRLLAEGKDFSRSRRGRWRPKGGILRRLASRWEPSA